jgi:RHS repeat-associated protein
MNSSGTYTISFTPTQSSVQLSIAYSYFNTNANTLCFTLDSVNYQQQSASVSSTQLVQVSNKLNDGYRFGYGNHEKIDEIAGAGNTIDMGARMLDTRLGRTKSLDPKMGLYPGISPYSYCLNTPIQAKDPDGKVVIFINGNHYGDGGKADYWRTDEKYIAGYRSEKNWKGDWVTSPVSMNREYAFDKNVMNALNDHKAIYRDGALGGFAPFNPNNISSVDRAIYGYAKGVTDAKSIIANLERDKNGNITETVKLVSHSMGGAYAKGYAQGLLDYAEKNKVQSFRIEFEADFSSFQPKNQKAIDNPNMGKTYQFSHKKDIVAGNAKEEGSEQMNTSNDPGQGHSIFDYKGQENTVGGLKEKK